MSGYEAVDVKKGMLSQERGQARGQARGQERGQAREGKGITPSRTCRHSSRAGRTRRARSPSCLRGRAPRPWVTARGSTRRGRGGRLTEEKDGGEWWRRWWWWWRRWQAALTAEPCEHRIEDLLTSRHLRRARHGRPRRDRPPAAEPSHSLHRRCDAVLVKAVAAPRPRVPDAAHPLQRAAAQRRLGGQSLAGEERVREGEALEHGVGLRRRRRVESDEDVGGACAAGRKEVGGCEGEAWGRAPRSRRVVLYAHRAGGSGAG